jgi:hypothetical protein
MSSALKTTTDAQTPNYSGFPWFTKMVAWENSHATIFAVWICDSYGAP